MNIFFILLSIFIEFSLFLLYKVKINTFYKVNENSLFTDEYKLNSTQFIS
jgi:hypothetical protein